MSNLIPRENLENRIFLIRGRRVMLDADLAELYGVPTKRLNEQVKRNRERFPEDFRFQLTQREFKELVAFCDRFRSLLHSPVRPHAFTEHGVIMLASVLNSRTAVQTSLLIVRAFVRLKDILATHKDLVRRIDELEKKYDARSRSVFGAIRQLMEPPAVPMIRVRGFSR